MATLAAKHHLHCTVEDRLEVVNVWEGACQVWVVQIHRALGAGLPRKGAQGQGASEGALWVVHLNSELAYPGDVNKISTAVTQCSMRMAAKGRLLRCLMQTA